MGTLWKNGNGACLGGVNRAGRWAGIYSSEPQKLLFEFLAVATVGMHERDRSKSSGEIWWAARVSIPAP